MKGQVYSLVLSCTQREKSYFRRFARLWSDARETNYLLLFDAIVKWKIDNDQTLRQRLSNPTILSRLSKEKNYLYNLLLKSLAAFHSKNTPQNHLRTKLQQVHLLFRKNLVAAAYKVLKKAKQEAYRYEEFSLLIEILDMEFQILELQAKTDYDILLGTYQEERRRVLGMMDNYFEHKEVMYQLNRFLESQRYEENAKAYLEKLSHNDLLINKEKALSIKAKELYYYNIGSLYYSQGQFQAWYELSFEHYDFFKNYEYLFSNQKKLQVLSNFLYACSLVGDKEMFFKLLALLDTYAETFPQKRAYIFYIRYQRLFELFWRQKAFEEGMPYLAELEAGIAEYIDSFRASHKEYLYSIVCQFLTEAKEYHLALSWIERYQESKVEKLFASSPQHYIIILLKIIAHYGLAYHKLLRYEVRSLQRELHKKGLLDDYWRPVIKCFASIAKEEGAEAEKEALQELKSELIQLKQEKPELPYFEFFDLLYWLD